MGGITYSTQQLDYPQNSFLKQSNNSFSRLSSKRMSIQLETKTTDSKTMIFSTIFSKPNKTSMPVTEPKFNKSYDYCEYSFSDKIQIASGSSPYSMIEDNMSEKSNFLVDIEESPLMNNSEIKKREKSIKQGKKLRMDYFAKLINTNVWQPMNKIKIHNSLFFYDWDDTLMCTSFITPNGQFSDGVKLNDKDAEKIKNLDTIVASIIKRSTELGEVYIITNAAPGWVEYSSKKFYPETSKYLQKVKIMSARGLFEKKFPGDMKQWKIKAFSEILKTLDTKLVTNVICLGDSIMEIEAAHIFASNFNHAYIKTVKFKENPMPIDLQKQLSLVVNQLDKIYSSVKNLAIRVEKKKND